MNNKNNYLLGLVFAAALGLGAYFVMAPQQNGLVGSSFGAANATTAGEADTQPLLTWSWALKMLQSP